MNESIFNLFGFSWRLGRHWGIAHPDHICYNTKETISVDNSVLNLGIKYQPQRIIIDDEPKLYLYSVGYVSSIETIKYGKLTIDFKLPLGKHLWPAIWLTDGKTWPPEIDIMEAWSYENEWPMLCMNSPKRIYRNNPFANKIFPGVVLEKGKGKSYREFRGSMACYLNTEKVNRCQMIWREDLLQVFYNGQKVAEEIDPKVLSYLNESEGMEIHLNNYVTNDFTTKDLNEVEKKENYTPNFQIYNLKYENSEVS